MQVEVFWVATHVVLCQENPATSIITLKMDISRFSKMLVSYCNTKWCHYQEHLDLNSLILTNRVTELRKMR